MSTEDRKKIHVLAVDDDADALATTVEYLGQLGFERITQATNGHDAIRLLESDPSIGMVISDWNMPLLNGLSLLQRVRSNPKLQHLPFVVVTSPESSEVEKVLMAAENMVNSYLVKPFRLKSLELKLGELFKKSVFGPQKKVVLADDDPDARQMVLEYLNSFGFKELMAFEDGASALKYVQGHHREVGLIVADWEMPKLTGLEMLSICKSTKHLSSIPFVIITSQSSMEKMKVMRAAKERVDNYLLKPFKGEDLKEKIDNALSRSRVAKGVKELTDEGFRLLGRGMHKEASKQFEKALRLDPGFDESLAGMGDYYFRSGNYNEAISYYRKAVAVNPYRDLHYFKLAASFEKMGDLEKGITLLQTAIQYVGFNSEVHFWLGQFYYKKNLLHKAKDEFEKVIELSPEHQEAKAMLKKTEISLKTKKRA